MDACRALAIMPFGLLAFLGNACGGSSDAPAAPVDGGTMSDAVADSAPADSTLPPDGSPGSDASPEGEGGTPEAAVDAGPCGLRSGMRGLTSRMMMVAGLNRTYLIYLPQARDPKKPVPLVFVMHGYTMSGQEMYDITGYAQLADTEGLAVAFPDGESGPNSLGAPWNVGANVCSPGNLSDATGDDIDFVTGMQADITQDQCIDTAHVFMAGFSMGGFFAHHMGCMRPDLVRGIAPHSAGTHDFSACVNGHKPVIVMHGDADPVIPESCDVTAVSQWVQKNGCSTTVNTMQVQSGHCDFYQGCPADGQVAFCVFQNMGHCWAGGAADGGVASCPAYASATQLQWDFFKMYAW